MSRAAAFTLGLIQMSPTPDTAANLSRATALIEKAGRAGARVICLPELFRFPYFCQREEAALFDLAESVPGPTTTAIGAVAARLKATVIVPLFERRAPGLYHNTAVIVDEQGEIAGLYRKMHIPDDPGYYEKFYFAPGDLGFKSFPTAVGPIGVLICWDQWYPEAARLTALEGATLLLYPSAIGWHPDEKAALGASQREAWITVQRGHAIANGVYVAAINRVGLERPDEAAPGIEFWGSTFVADPFGGIVASASSDREELLLAEIDPGRVEEVRRGWPFLRDRRIDAYGGIGARYLDEGS